MKEAELRNQNEGLFGSTGVVGAAQELRLPHMGLETPEIPSGSDHLLGASPSDGQGIFHRVGDKWLSVE